MKKGFIKKAMAALLAGTMIVGSTASLSAAENDEVITTPVLQVAMPNATDGFGQVSAENNLPELGFNTNIGSLDTITEVRGAVFESDEDEHNGFNGVYSFTHSDGAFNVSGRYPMVLAFDVKLDETITSLASSSADIIGKMDEDYGIQIVRNAEDRTGDWIYAYTSSGNWATARLSLGEGAFNNWTSVVVLYDGHTFWISADGGETFSSSIANNNFALPNTDAKFGIGFNSTKNGGNGRSMREGIYLDNVKMYRSYGQVGADDARVDAAELAESLMVDENLLLGTEYIAPKYTVGATTWYQGTGASGTPAENYEPGQPYTFSTTFTAREGYVFSEANVPTDITIGYGSIPVNAEVSVDGRSMTVTGTYAETGIDYDLNRETTFWDREVENGTITEQNEDEQWLYQIREKESGNWINIPANAYYPTGIANYEDTGEPAPCWLNNGGQHGTYHWSKISRDQITCTFGNTAYDQVAYKWRAPQEGYYRATLAQPIERAENFSMEVAAYSGEQSEQIAQDTYAAGDTFTSRIVKLTEGDSIRFIATNGWATGFEPMIEEVTVREYVEQWRADNADILGRYDNGLYTEETVQAVTEAIEALDAALSGEDESAIEAAFEVLQEKLSALQENVFNKNIQTEYWEYSKLSGTLPVQDDSDIWYYQVKENGSWENVADSYFDADAFDGDGVWMSDGNTMPNPYYYAAIGKTKLTPCFNNDTYGGVAFAWKASESGYARVRFAEAVSLGSNWKAAVTLTISKGASTNDSETLLTKEIALGETYQADDFTTKYVYVSAGDYLRISAASANNDVLGVTPVIETMTVREYATQYLEEVQGIDLSDKPAVSAGEFDEARTDLDGLLKKEPSATDEEIKAAVDKLELAEANLDKYTVTYIYTDSNGEKQTAKFKQDYNDEVTIVTTIPEGMQFAGWRLNSEDGVIVSQKESYTFLVAGDMTVIASFAEEETLMPAAVSISNVHIVKRDDDSGRYNVRFNGQVTKPESYGLYEAGLLWSTAPINTEGWTWQTDPGTLGGLRKVNVDSVSSSYQYSVTINKVPAGTTIYGVAFAKVYNPDEGRYEWVYSQVETAAVPAAQ